MALDRSIGAEPVHVFRLREGQQPLNGAIRRSGRGSVLTANGDDLTDSRDPFPHHDAPDRGHLETGKRYAPTAVAGMLGEL